eukprot:scaffold92110_cov42-Attheya_sp.AAC.1
MGIFSITLFLSKQLGLLGQMGTISFTFHRDGDSAPKFVFHLRPYSLVAPPELGRFGSGDVRIARLLI